MHEVSGLGLRDAGFGFGLYCLSVLTLGAPVVPFYPFSFWVPLLKPTSRKKGTLIIKGLLGNLVHAKELVFHSFVLSGSKNPKS